MILLHKSVKNFGPFLFTVVQIFAFSKITSGITTETWMELEAFYFSTIYLWYKQSFVVKWFSFKFQFSMVFFNISKWSKFLHEAVPAFLPLNIWWALLTRLCTSAKSAQLCCIWKNVTKSSKLGIFGKISYCSAEYSVIWLFVKFR